jgi:uncharacterized protein (DUF433 family)
MRHHEPTAGRSEVEILADFPALRPDAIKAALAYAADVVGSEHVLVATP